MVDILGPGSQAGTQAVTTRPGETRTFGGTDTWAKDCSSPSANDGTIPPAAWFNAITAQLREAIRQAGVTDNNADDQMLWKAIKGAGQVVGRTQVFTSSGTFTVPVGITSVEVEVVGGGGAGGASGNGGSGGTAGNPGGGGGGGGYSKKRVTGLTPGGTVSVTVGAAGVAASAAAGGAGGSSSFGAHCSATGGGGGGFGENTLASGGVGGTGTGGDENIAGGTGGLGGTNNATPTASHILNMFIRGGMVAKGWGVVPWGGTGIAGVGYGVGGGGASGGSGLAGGNGAPGIVVVRW